jgi:regulatory factor X
MAMFLAHPPDAYHHHGIPMPMYAAPQTISPNPEALHAAGQFNRMTLSPDQGLEKLAANVRAATTTSASDRAKQIFVQAW